MLECNGRTYLTFSNGLALFWSIALSLQLITKTRNITEMVKITEIVSRLRSEMWYGFTR